MTDFPRVASFKTAAAFRNHLRTSGVNIELDDVLDPPGASPLASGFDLDGVHVGNRFCILPMEGWDGTADGEPSELTRRRWQHFGISGAKLIWGGEAVAVRHDGRANPRQVMLTPKTQRAIAGLRDTLIAAHRERFGANAGDDLFVGLQLTHSGRYSQPNVHKRPEPRAAYAHPLLDRRFPAGVPLMTDEDLDRLVEQFIDAARMARDAGFAFVDIKHCHGYLGHELLSARTRQGRYGGSFQNRTRFLRSVAEGIRAEVPGLRVALRLSAFDVVPFRKGETGVGVPEQSHRERSRIPDTETDTNPYQSAFGLLRDGGLTDGGLTDGAVSDGGMDAALGDARELLAECERLGIRWVCITGGSPYYCPHVQRPALFPPSDGYEPPEDPLVGVARHIDATARLKQAHPSLAIAGSAYSYLQDWLPYVAQYTVRHGMTDFVGLGRMVLSYPELPADVLAGRPLQRKRVCRTFSDCTTGPRLGLVSGCYPLDEFYKSHEQAERLATLKQGG